MISIQVFTIFLIPMIFCVNNFGVSFPGVRMAPNCSSFHTQSESFIDNLTPLGDLILNHNSLPMLQQPFVLVIGNIMIRCKVSQF